MKMQMRNILEKCKVRTQRSMTLRLLLVAGLVILFVGAGTKIDLTAQVQGILPAANGGSGAGTFTAHGVLIGEGTSPFNVTAVCATGTFLGGNTGADPTCQTPPAVPTFVYSEVPSGTINSSNVTFTLANTPTSGTLRLYLNGIRQQAGGGNDYTLATATITYVTAPNTGDVLLADYNH